VSSERREPLDIRVLRAILHRLPLPRGKSAFMRLAGPLLRRRNFLMEVEPGLYVPPELEDRIVYWCFVDGNRSWDPIMELSRRVVTPGATVVDVGAHVGFWVMGAARRAARNGRVLAFEPLPANLARLRRNLALNRLDFVECVPLALSDTHGTATFYAPTEANKGIGSLARRSGASRPFDVETVELDRYCASHGIAAIDVMKLDVEGAELHVLRGALGMLRRSRAPVVMFEADDDLAAAFGSATADVKRLLITCGYQVYRYDGLRLRVVAPNETHRGEDLLALTEAHFQTHACLAAMNRPS